MTRRTFSATLAAAPLMADLKPALIRLGGPVFIKSEDPGELAREHRRLGYSAAYCPKASLEEPERIAAIQKAFAAENVVIAEVGAWINMMDPDAAKRKKAIEYVTGRCALADAVGARCCVDYAGSYNAEIPWGAHPRNLSQDFFDGTVENCRKIVDAVKPKRTHFTIEMEKWSLPNGPDAYLKLIRAVDRPAFAVHLDCTNVVDTVRKFYNTSAVISECFEKLGRWVMSCHAKDVRWVPAYHIHFEECIPGRGVLDYSTYLRELSKMPRETPLMLEHLKTADEYVEAATHIRKVAAENQLKFA
jgi:sugar phosphate isomerase/epimerase